MLLKSFEEKLRKSKKNPSVYMPLIKLLLEEKKPLSIRTMSQSLNVDYSLVKQRLRKMELAGFLERGKRGIYSFSQHLKKFKKQKKPRGKPLIVNGALRRIAKTIRFQIYCSALTKVCKEKFCSVEQLGENILLLRKSNQFVGRKMHPLKGMATAVILSSNIFLEGSPPDLGKKNKRIKVKFYPNEWGISLKNALGTENIKDGELGEELAKYGKIRKGSRGSTIKTDLVFELNGKKAYIELTQAKRVRNSRSDIKAMEIQARLYYALKSSYKESIPMFIIIDENWDKSEWLSRELDFLKETQVTLLFTNFNGKWAKCLGKKIARKLKIAEDSSKESF